MEESEGRKESKKNKKEEECDERKHTYIQTPKKQKIDTCREKTLSQSTLDKNGRIFKGGGGGGLQRTQRMGNVQKREREAFKNN